MSDRELDPMRTTYDEDAQTRQRLDSICENAIAAALLERFGFVPLSLRYRLAREAVQACRTEVEPTQQRIRSREAGELRQRQTLLALEVWRLLTAEFSMLESTYEDAQRAAWLGLDDEQRQLILERYDACDPRTRDRL